MTYREPEEEATSSATEHLLDAFDNGCACGAVFGNDVTALSNHFWDAGYQKGREDERRLHARIGW